MENNTKRFLIILTLIVLSFWGGRYFGYKPDNQKENTTSLTDLVNVQELSCQNDLNCFGTGRELFAETSNAILWDLISTKDFVRIGIEEKETGKLYELRIE